MMVGGIVRWRLIHPKADIQFPLDCGKTNERLTPLNRVHRLASRKAWRIKTLLRIIHPRDSIGLHPR